MSDDETTGRPGGQPANRNSVRHGAYSSDLDDLVPAHAEALIEECPWLELRHYRSHVASIARLELMVDRLHRYVEVAGPLDGKGRVRPAAKQLDRLESQLESLRSRSGMDPESGVRLDLLNRWEQREQRIEEAQARPLADAAIQTASEFLDAAELHEFRKRIAQRLRHYDDPDQHPPPEPREPRRGPEVPRELGDARPSLPSVADFGGGTS